MSTTKHTWWDPDSSQTGSILMALVALATYFTLSYHGAAFKYQWLGAGAAGLAFGILFNLVAHVRKTKKIHWLDFFWIDLIPW